MFRRTVAKLSRGTAEYMNSSGQMVTEYRERSLTHIQDRFEQLIVNRVVTSQHYAPVMIFSKSMEEAQFHTRAFYRKIVRLLPMLLRQYTLQEISPVEAKARVRALFRAPHPTTYESVDGLRWDAEVVFTDVVRMYFTKPHVVSILFPDANPHLLPALPAAALPLTTNPDVVAITENASDFMAEFLDSKTLERKSRVSQDALREIM